MLKMNRMRSFKTILGLGATLMALGGPSALAVCGDVSGDGSLQVNDAVLAVRASAGLENLDTGANARADVAASNGTPDSSLQVSDAVLIVRASAGLETLVCNESITAGQTVMVPIRYKNGSTGSYKGFQATVSVTGATLQTTTDADLKSAKTWNTCKMNANNGKVLCVDTSEKVAASSTGALAYVRVTAPQSGSFSVTVADALQVDSSTGATTSATGMHETLTYTVGQAPPN